MNNKLLFTVKEKKSVIRVLKSIAIADGRVENSEKVLLTRIGGNMGVSLQQFRDADELTLLDAIVVIKDMSFDKKQEVSNAMTLMAIIDADADVREAVIVSYVMSVCGLPQAVDGDRLLTSSILR